MILNRWIGRQGAIEWPPRSPDLTSLDYLLWGYIKERVYQNIPCNIIVVTNSIPIEAIQNYVDGFYHRLGACQIEGGIIFNARIILCYY